MEKISRRQLLELMAGVGCAVPLSAMAATWKQVSPNAGGGQTWKPIAYTGPAGTNWKKLGAAGLVTINLVIAANTLNYNIKAAAIATGWNGTTPANCTVTVNSGVVVGSSSTSAYAMDTGTGWPAGTQLSLNNNGYVIGVGGAGAPVGSPGVITAGLAGGPSLYLRYPITITNGAGYIYSGGGGGGSGGQVWFVNSLNSHTPGGYYQPYAGGGGAGYYGGAAGAGMVAPYDPLPGGISVGGAGGNRVAAGGALNVAGAVGSGVNGCGGGGGGANGGGGGLNGPAGGHGLAITTNGNAITWVSGNTRVYGGVA